jgi:hypothetical protein
LGAYLFPQYGFDANWLLGVRGDLYTVQNLKDATTGASLGNGTYALVPTLTYKPSEFSTLRAAYTREWTSLEGTDTASEHAFELQATFILGTHPAHDF